MSSPSPLLLSLWVPALVSFSPPLVYPVLFTIQLLLPHSALLGTFPPGKVSAPPCVNKRPGAWAESIGHSPLINTAISSWLDYFCFSQKWLSDHFLNGVSVRQVELL
jgi:hypothetical protein